MNNKLDKISVLYEMYGENIEKIPKENIEEILYTSRVRSKSVLTIGMYYLVLGKGGVQRVLSLLAPLYLEMGYRVIVITEEEPQDSDYVFPKEVKRYTVPGRKSIVNGRVSYYERAEGLANILEKEKIDVFCHHGATEPLLLYDMMVTKANGVPFVLVKHQFFSIEIINGKDYYRIYKQMFAYMDAIVVLSQLEERYWRKLGINSYYIPNPVNPKIKKEYPYERKYILWEGRLDSIQKNFMDVVDIMRLVIEKCPKAKMKVYGSGDPVSKQILQRAILQNDMQENIEYCGYVLDLEEMYGKAAVHLSTSAVETFPMGVFESKLFGVPLVIYSLPYLELLKDGKGYISVPQGNVVEAANAVVKILEDSVYAQKLHLEAIESGKRFNNENVKEKWGKLFENINKQWIRDDLRDVEFEQTLDTIFQNIDIRMKKQEETVSELRDKLWMTKLRYKMQEGKNKVAIFPYGIEGKRIESKLHEKKIEINYIIDNYFRKDNVMTMKEFNAIEHSDVIVLFCCQNRNLYFDLLDEIANSVGRENIIDVCLAEEIF